MSNTQTVNHLFDVAIAAENAAEAMYYILAESFAAYPSVAQFWREMAHGEVIHARALERIRSRLDGAALSAPASSEILTRATEAGRFDMAAAARAVVDLEAAYQLAHEVENSEINAVFEFLVGVFPENHAVGDFLREQLQIHIRKLVTAFPEPYHQAEMRRGVRPVRP